MIIVNHQGLSDADIEKIQRPFAENSGQPIDWDRVAREAVAAMAESSTLLKDVGALLDSAQV